VTVSYVLDTGAFYTLGHFYPSRFPTIWARINSLVLDGRLWSVREVRRELENNCPFPHIEEWLGKNLYIFNKPNAAEMEVVSQIFRVPLFQGLVRRTNILKGLPVADPFVVASAKIHNGAVVTREIFRDKGARIPTVCKQFDVECITVEQFLEKEKLKF
jgi:hypothetical protein